MQSLSSAFTAFRRAPLLSALSITTIAFSLFAFGLFALVALNISDALDQVEERVEVRAFVDKSADRAEEQARKWIGAYWDSVIAHYEFDKPHLKSIPGY